MLLQSATTNNLRCRYRDTVHFRDDMMLSHDAILYSRLMLLIYSVDAWLTIEATNLRWVSSHVSQRIIHAESSQGLQDATSAEVANGVGRITVLPSSFPGSPRYFQSLYHDAMAVVRAHGKPDFFITCPLCCVHVPPSKR